MRILVTGAAGFVGSFLVPNLLQGGHEVYALDNMMYGIPTLLTYHIHDRFHFVRGDVTDSRLVQDLVKKVDCVIHLAALVGYPICNKFPAMARSVNVDGTRNIVEALEKNQTLIHASTASGYGLEKDICDEETPLNPLTLYGDTKAKAEEIVRGFGHSIVLRFATAFGLSPRVRLDLLVNNLVYEAVRNKMLLIYEKSYIRPFIHVRDMARAFAFSLDRSDSMLGQVFNVGSDNLTLTKEDLARRIRQRTNCQLVFADVGKDLDRRNYRVSFGKFESQGYRTSVTIEQGIDELAKGFSEFRIPTGYSNNQEY